MLRLLTFLLFLFSIVACTSNPEKDKKTSSADSIVVKEKFVSGKVIDNVACKNYPNNSFALYLPTSYSSEKKYPVIFAIDPQATGKLPVANYKELAEKYNYIIVGSNNSENGKSWEEANQIVNTLLADIKNRFSVNTSRMYLLGFSGGARIANAVTMSNGEIEAVICCGAISPAASTPVPRSNYSLVCIAGTADFNYTEVCKYEKVEGHTIKHTLIKFDGKHEWPPLATMDDAFWFLELNEMRKSPAVSRDSLINPIIEKETKELNDLLANNKSYEAFEKCKKVIVYYNGLHDLKEFYKAYQGFKTNKEVDETLRIEEAFWKLEEEEKQKYIQAFRTNDLNWWKIHIVDLNKKIKSGKNKEEVNMQKRLLSFLSLVAYMQTTATLKEKNMKAASYFSDIYVLVDPTNNEAHYLKAEINAINGKTKEAIQSLNESIKYDFKDLKRLESDILFNSVKNEEGFKKIVGKLKEL